MYNLDTFKNVQHAVLVESEILWYAMNNKWRACKAGADLMSSEFLNWKLEKFLLWLDIAYD